MLQTYPYLFSPLIFGTSIALRMIKEWRAAGPSGNNERFSMKEEKRNTWGSHSFWMILCCAIPLVGIIILSLLGILGSWGFYALILLCPLLHLFFMRRMGSKDMHKGSSKNHMMGSGR